MTSPYLSKYIAHELTRRLPADKAEKLAQSLSNATVDLNPHQVEAALFAFRSPLSRGAVLADEVGLGKPWKYLLIPHDKVDESKTLAGLAGAYEVRHG